MNKKQVRIFYVIGAFALGAMVLFAAGLGQASNMAVFTVNTILDTDDGSCDLAHCSLREAIKAANNAAGSDNIAFSLLPSATITLAGSQLPAITDTLTIDGGTAVSLTISGDNLSRIFTVGSGTAVTLTLLTIEDGRADSGGAIYNDEGILIVQNSTLSNNFALLNGGGIYNDDGTLIILDSIYQVNTAQNSGGAIFTDLEATTLISNTDFQGNTAEIVFSFPGTSGGAITNYGALTIFNSSFTNNGALAYDDPNNPTFSAFSSGGGIDNHGTLAVHGSTFNNNLSFSVAPYLANFPNHNSFGVGGGYSSSGGGITNNGLLTVSNSTFSGNRAYVAMTFNYSDFLGSEAIGGGIANGATMTITNSTFTGNTTTILPIDGIPVGGGGGGVDSSGTMVIKNTIIANSDESDDCVNSGTILINLNNLVEDGSCSPFLTGDPLLGPLQFNGGPNLTHALTSPSPAVDHGDEATCAAPPVNNIDQRGVIRPLDGNGDGTPRCDIGAYEYDGPPPYRSYLPISLKN